MSDIGDNITWNERLEEYFASSGEKAHCLGLMHKQAEALYSRRRNFIDLPVIIGSAAIGFLNAGSSTMFDDPKISSVALGVGSLLVGVLQTVNTYFNWSKRAEGHRISAIQYSKLYRFLSLEMSLPRNERISPTDLLKQTRDTYDRLQEISPILPPEILDAFKKKYENDKEISKPEEANGLEKIEVYNDTPFVNPLRRVDSFSSEPPKATSPKVRKTAISTEILKESVTGITNLAGVTSRVSQRVSPKVSPKSSPHHSPKNVDSVAGADTVVVDIKEA